MGRASDIHFLNLDEEKAHETYGYLTESTSTPSHDWIHEGLQFLLPVQDSMYIFTKVNLHVQNELKVTFDDPTSFFGESKLLPLSCSRIVKDHDQPFGRLDQIDAVYGDMNSVDLQQKDLHEKTIQNKPIKLNRADSDKNESTYPKGCKRFKKSFQCNYSNCSASFYHPQPLVAVPYTDLA